MPGKEGSGTNTSNPKEQKTDGELGQLENEDTKSATKAKEMGNTEGSEKRQWAQWMNMERSIVGRVLEKTRDTLEDNDIQPCLSIISIITTMVQRLMREGSAEELTDEIIEAVCDSMEYEALATTVAQEIRRGEHNDHLEEHEARDLAGHILGEIIFEDIFGQALHEVQQEGRNTRTWPRQPEQMKLTNGQQTE